MNASILIDSTVRQVTVLIAQLATSGGIRAPLARVANQVFVELAHELESQGVSRKVSADMFGMALRAYIRKVRRLTEGESGGGKTLWEAVLEFVRKEGMASRTRVLERFQRDGELEVSSILKDLSDSGFLLTTGTGASLVYRAATDAEIGTFSQHASGKGLDELVWALIFRSGPLTLTELAAQISHTEEETSAVVGRLLGDGRVQMDGESISAREFVIPLGAENGWEASVFDHVQAMVQTICQRLRAVEVGATPSAPVGGSTYTFDVWPGHPEYEEVRSQLAAHRTRLSELRTRVEEFNASHGRAENFEQVVAYVGQCVIEREKEETVA